MIAFMHADMLAFRNQVFLRLAYLRRNNHLSFAFCILAERNTTIYLGDNGEVFRLTRLEQLSNARQTTSDVFCLRCFTWDLCNDITGTDDSVVLDGDVGTHWQKVSPNGSACAVSITTKTFDGDTRAFITI